MAVNKTYLFQKGHKGYWLGRHFSRDHKNKIGLKMEEHPQWKGGVIIHNGYRMVKRPDHPFCRSSGYIMEHRLIMEQHIGRYLLPSEIVHHINGNTLDNRIENLELIESNISHNKQYHIPNKRRDIPHDEVFALVKTGHSQRSIGRMFNASHNVIKRILVEGCSYGKSN